MAEVKVELEGVQQVVRMFRELDVEAQKLTKRWLRVAAAEVAAQAKKQAKAEQLTPPGRSGRSTGNLESGIRPSVTKGTMAAVVEKANRDGFPYPRIYEYAKHRSFMHPTVDIMRPVVIEQYNALLRELIATVSA